MIKLKARANVIENAIAFDEAGKRLEEKFRVMFNRRLNYQKSVLLTLYSALEGAAQGVSAEETLKKLEPYKEFMRSQKVVP